MAPRKSSKRRSHKRSHKRTHRRRSQKGGSQCGALRQSGGMAPFAAGDAYLLDAQTRVQAEVGPLDKAFADLPSVIPRQAGGRRHRRRSVSHKKRAHKHKGSRKVCTRKHKQSRSRRSLHRSQRGGALAPFAGSYTLIDHHAMTPKMLAQNDQFVTESSVNSDYSQFAGAQHA